MAKKKDDKVKISVESLGPDVQIQALQLILQRRDLVKIEDDLKVTKEKNKEILLSIMGDAGADSITSKYGIVTKTSRPTSRLDKDLLAKALRGVGGLSDKKIAYIIEQSTVLGQSDPYITYSRGKGK
jgi:hypothetical protein